MEMKWLQDKRKNHQSEVEFLVFFSAGEVIQPQCSHLETADFIAYTYLF